MVLGEHHFGRAHSSFAWRCQGSQQSNQGTIACRLATLPAATPEAGRVGARCGRRRKIRVRFYQPFYNIVRATLPPWGAGAPSLESNSIALTAPIRINNHTYQPPVYLYCTYLPSTRIGRKFTLPSIAARSRNRQATCALRRESTRAPPQRLPAWRSRATFRRRLASG